MIRIFQCYRSAQDRRRAGLAAGVVLFACLMPVQIRSQTVEVRLEPLPPLVTDNGGGLVTDMLRLIEADSDLVFNISTMPYNRAKYHLNAGRADVIGLTPRHAESPAFYRYAQDLQWQIELFADVFSLDESLLALDPVRTFYVGTPPGNAEFFAQMSGVPLDHFIEAPLENLVQMLARGRVDVVIWERVSMRREIQREGVQGIHYRLLQSLSASFGVRNDSAGQALAESLDGLLAAHDWTALFAPFRAAMQVPAAGEVEVLPRPAAGLADGVATAETEGGADAKEQE